ncbi:MAG: TIR domain-containing protein [Bacteroidota bacterium]
MGKPTVLWVDDDPSFCNEMEDFFGKKYDLHFANSLNEASPLLKEKSFQLAIIDLDLGDKESGIDLVRMVKGQNPGLPIVVISNGKHRDLTLAQETGADYTFAKSEFDAHDWMERFQSFIESQVSIFLSHTSSDKPFVRRLKRELNKAGFKTWLDEDEIKAGDSLLEKIHDGLGKVDYLLAILTPKSVESNWVKEEIKTARKRQFDGVPINGKVIKVIPLMYEKCDLPLFLSGDVVYADWTTVSTTISNKKEQLAEIICEPYEFKDLRKTLCEQFDEAFDISFKKLCKDLQQ